LIILEVTPGTLPTVTPSARLSIPGPDRIESYALQGVIYLGGYHFIARTPDNSGNIWSYDSQMNCGYRIVAGWWRTLTIYPPLPILMATPLISTFFSL
jgi:hypothetical protein